MRAPLSAFLVAVVAAALGVSSTTHAQDGDAKQKGIRGKVTVAPELLAATEWPVGAEREKARSTPSRIHRPSGRSVVATAMEPRPELVVVLVGEGARNEGTPSRPIKLEGMRFVPSQLLMARPGPVTIENKQTKPVTVVNAKGDALVTIEPGASGTAKMTAGDETLSTIEFPYARASVRVLDRAVQLPFDEATGEMALQTIEGGEYKLEFYLGIKPLLAQPIQLFEDRVMFIEATVSAKEVVVVTIKDASLRIAIPPSHIPQQPADPESGP